MPFSTLDDGILPPWCDAPCHTPPYSAMLFEGLKNYGTTKRGNELSKTKNRGLVDG